MTTNKFIKIKDKAIGLSLILQLIFGARKIFFKHECGPQTGPMGAKGSVITFKG